MTDPRLLPGKKFDLKTYLQTGYGKGAFGGTRDPLRSQGARIEYARRYGQYSQPLTPGERVIATSPKGDMSKYNQWKSDKAAREQAQAQRQQESWQDRQANRLASVAETGSTIEGETAEEYRERAEGTRVNLADQYFAKHGERLQDTYEVTKEEKAWMAMMSPAELQKRQEYQNGLISAADYTLWKMAEQHYIAFETPEVYAQFKGYMANWLNSVGTPDQALWDVKGMLWDVAFNDITPMPLDFYTGITDVDVPINANGNVQWGDVPVDEWVSQHPGYFVNADGGISRKSPNQSMISNGDVWTVADAAGFSVDISGFKYGGDESLPDPIATVSVDAQGHVSLVVTQYLNADKTSERDIEIDPNDYRVRDFTVPQTVTLDEAKKYFDIDSDDAEILYIIQERVNESGERGLALVGQVIDDWTVHFNEDETRTYVDKWGVEYDQSGFDAVVAEDEAKKQAALDEFNSTVGPVMVDLLTTTNWQIEGVNLRLTEDDRALAYPQSANWWRTMTFEDSNVSLDERGNLVIPSIQVETEEGEVEAYVIPNPNNIFDPSNLPEWAILDADGTYQIDIANVEGAKFFKDYYPFAFWNLVRSAGKTDAAVTWLKDEYEWTDEQVDDFFTIRTAPTSIPYDPSKMQVSDVYDSNNPFNFINAIGAGLAEASYWGTNQVYGITETIIDTMDFKNQLDSWDKQDIVTYVSESIIDATEAAAITRVGMVSPPVTGSKILDTALTANYRSSTIGGAAIRTYGIYTAALNTFDLVDGFIGAYANKNPELGDNLLNAWRNYGLSMFFNNSIHEAVRAAGDVPGWLLTANQWTAAFAPMGWPTGLSRMWGMPIIFKRMRGGAFSLVKTIDSFETLKTVANYRGWAAQKVNQIPEYINRARGIFNDVVYVKGKPLEGGYLINDGRRYVYCRDLREAENFIRFGNTEGLRLGDIPADFSGLVFDIGGQKFPLAELPGNLETIANAIKNHPGSLGRGWWGAFKGALRGRDVSKLSAEEIVNIARSAIERGEISLEEIVRICKLLKLRKDESIRGYIELYKSWFKANAGDITQMLPENKNGELLTGWGRFSDEAESIFGDTLPKPNTNGLYASNTIAEYWKYCEFTNPQVKVWFSAAHDFISQLNKLAELHGITKGRHLYKEWTDTMGVLKEYFPRKVTGRRDMAKKVDLPADFLKSREWQNAEEAVADGLQYGTLEDSLFSFAGQVYRRIEAKQLADLLRTSGLLKPLLEETIEGRILRETAKKSTKYLGQAELLRKLIRRVKRGERLPGADSAWITKNFPEFADAIKQLEYYNSDRALRDTLRDITNRLRARRNLLELDIRSLKTGTKEKIGEFFTPIQSKITKLRDYEGTLKAIIRGRLPSDISEDFVAWLKESQLGQRIIPEIEKYRALMQESVPMKDSLGAMAIKNRQQAQLQVIIDELSSLRIALEEELAFFKGQSVEELTRSLTQPQALLDKINAANSLLDQIWKIEKPQNKLGQLKELLERNFPTEFGQRIDDALGFADSNRANELYAELQNKALSLIDEAEALKVTADINLKTAMDLLKHHNFEAVAQLPGISGRIFDDIVINGKRINGKDIYKMYERIWRDKPNSVLRLFENISRGILPLWLAVDFSGMLVQGLPMMGLDVANNLKVLATGVGSFQWRYLRACEYYLGATGTSMVDILGQSLGRNPNLTAKFIGGYRTRNRWVIVDMVQHGGLINDGTDFFAGIGLWNKAIGYMPFEPAKRLLGAVTSPYTASSVGFGAWGEIARIETYRTLNIAWKMGGGTKSELAEFCNILTGSLLEPGRSANQISAEAAALIAPRYYKANFMMLNRMMPVGWKYGGAKRGMTGRMLTESLGGMVGGTVATYTALCYAMGQEPKLDFRPKSLGGDGAEAMTVKIGDYYIGIPGFWYGFIKACAGAIATAQENPDKLFSIDMDRLYESPAGIWLSWLSSKSGPLVSLTREAVTGRDFMGNRLDEVDYLEYIYKKLVPIAWQTLIEEDKPGRVEAWGFNIVGARAFSEYQWEAFYEQVQEYLEAVPMEYLTPNQIRKLDAGTLSWGDLDALQQSRILDAHPELQPLYDAALEASRKYDTDEMRAWRDERETYDAQSVEAETLALADLRDASNNDQEGAIVSTYDWRQKDGDNSANNRRNNEDLLRRFADIYALFDENDTETATAFALAYQAWNDDVWNSEGLHDQYGNFLPSVLEARKDEWKKTYGNFYDEVLELQRYGLKDDDPFKLFWYESRETLANCGYWDLPEGKDREEYRKSPLNVEAEALLVFWGYTTTIQYAEAEDIVREWCKEYNIPETAILALSAFILPDDMATKYDITDPGLWRQYIETEGSATGWDKRYFLKQNREIYNYLIGEGLLTGTIDNFDLIPEPEEHALLEYYDKIEGDNAEVTEVMRKMWRCTNEAGDAALVKYQGKSPLYGGNVCRVFLATQGLPAQQASSASQFFTGSPSEMPINLPTSGNVSSEEEALKREAGNY